MGISKDDVKDVVFATVKGAVSATPLVGGLLSEYIGLAQEKVANKRMTEWIQLIEDKLQKLSSRFDELTESEFFYSCVQLATGNAMRAYQREKRQLFANALYNSVVIDLDQDKKLFFMSLLDQYTLTGIKLLKYYSENHYNDDDYVRNCGMVVTHISLGTENPIKHVLENNPEFNRASEYMISLSEQLMGDSLIYPIDFKIPESPKQARRKRTTKLGDEFLQFIFCNE
ncbi:MAG: hypothetical protein Q8882_01650 [Bacillota bacterium]|nr:hypothetical protein [Bacillota bacterium]